MTDRAYQIRLRVEFFNLFKDVFFNLTDPHSGQIVDLTDFLQRMRTALSSDDDAVKFRRVWDPVRTFLSLTTYVVFRMGRETRTARSV